jgi:hypothetical protein
MQQIDEERLETDLQYRYDYLADFIGFGPEDISLIQTSAPHLGPRIPELVDRTYRKLLNYDATARHFVPRQDGYDGDVPTDISTLSETHPHVQFRKDHLNRYFMQLIGRSYDAKMALYLDMVGKMHTHKAGNAAIDVPLVQMNVLMGLISDTLMQSIAEWPLDATTALRTARAFNKLFCLQNDLISRHYVSPAAKSANGPEPRSSR